MTLFDDETIADYLEALGESATVGDESLLVDLVDDDQQIEVAGELLAGRPYALADPAEVTAAGVIVGSVLALGGKSWTVSAIEDDQAGFTTLWLEAV